MPGIEALIEAAAMNLRDCLESALGDRSYPVSATCLLPGGDFRQFLSVGLNENLCCGGYAGVQVVNIQPRFPEDPRQLDRCGVTTWQVDLAMGVARCAPSGDQNSGPSCPEWTSVAQQVISDAGAMIAAVCCFRPLVPSEVATGTNWVPFDPDGGCTGGIMGVSIQIDQCGCEGES